MPIKPIVVLFAIGGIMIICAFIQIIIIFRDTLKECDRIENESFLHGNNMSEENLKKEIDALKNTKTEWNSYERMKNTFMIQGLEKALNKKTSICTIT